MTRLALFLLPIPSSSVLSSGSVAEPEPSLDNPEEDRPPSTIHSSSSSSSSSSSRSETNAALTAFARKGLLLSALAILVPSPLLLLALLLMYRSIRQIGGPFFTFQWDALLCEFGVLGVLAAAARSRAATATVGVACQALLLRLMLGSGVVKLCASDDSWRKLEVRIYIYIYIYTHTS